MRARTAAAPGLPRRHRLPSAHARGPPMGGGEGRGAGHAGKCSFRRGAAAAGPVGFLYTIKYKVVQKRCPPVIPAAPSNSCCSLGGVHLANKHKDPSVPQPWPLAPHFTSQNFRQMYIQALRTLNNSQNKAFPTLVHVFRTYLEYRGALHRTAEFGRELCVHPVQPPN